MNKLSLEAARVSMEVSSSSSSLLIPSLTCQMDKESGEDGWDKLAPSPAYRAKRDRSRGFECKECMRKFSQSNHLLDHQNIHEGKRPHSCSLCGATFYKKYIFSCRKENVQMYM